jgi:hypothetical protein
LAWWHPVCEIRARFLKIFHGPTALPSQHHRFDHTAAALLGTDSVGQSR